jgi:hypothetical protein
MPPGSLAHGRSDRVKKSTGTGSPLEREKDARRENLREGRRAGHQRGHASQGVPMRSTRRVPGSATRLTLHRAS